MMLDDVNESNYYRPSEKVFQGQMYDASQKKEYRLDHRRSCLSLIRTLPRDKLMKLFRQSQNKQYNPIGRRNNHVAIQTNLSEDELEENEDYESNKNRIELRSKRHKKKRHIDNNDNIKNKSEDTKTTKILNAEKEKLVENKLIELIKKKLKKHLDGEAKKKNEMIKNGVNQLSKENIVEHDLEKTNVNKDENLENLKKQKVNHDKHFDIDTEMRISSGERDKGEKRKVEKKKHVEKSDFDSPPKPKRFDVISKELSEEHNEYDSTKPNKKALSTHGTDQEDEKAKPRGNKKNECINETEANIDKCVRACQRTHEDVCDLLTCSARKLFDIMTSMDGCQTLPRDCKFRRELSTRVGVIGKACGLHHRDPEFESRRKHEVF
ncbi:unnamed protein product [Spodoptera exigua]|nr:unnamed protein product [Spodoptera exigua]